MLKALTSIFTPREASPARLHRREWERCLATATSQNEIDEINDMFAGALGR